MRTLEKIMEAGRMAGLTQEEINGAIARVAGSAGEIKGNGSGDSQLSGRVEAYLEKLLNDNPMFIGWALRTASSLGETPWKKFVENLIISVVAKRKEIVFNPLFDEGFLPPFTMVLNPTMACNLRCKGCWAYKYNRETMDHDLLRRALSEGRDLGMRFITLTGGEPFIYKRIMEIFEEFNDLTFLTYTNGTLIDEKAAARLAELGNVFPAISIEGYRELTDDRRGEGVFDKTMRAMDNLREHGVMFGVSITPTLQNSDTICTDDFLDMCIGKGALFAWMFNYIPIGRDPDVTMMPTPEQRDKLRGKIVEWRKTKPFFFGDFWNDGPCIAGCMAASRYCFISPDGMVQPCTFAQFATHNIKDHSLAEIFRSPFFKAIRKAQPYSQNLLRCCMIIDHPEVLRSLAKEHGAVATYDGGESVIEDPVVTAHLDRYSQAYKKVSDPVWEGPDYESGRKVFVPFLGYLDVNEFFSDRMGKFFEEEGKDSKAAKVDGPEQKRHGHDRAPVSR